MNYGMVQQNGKERRTSRAVFADIFNPLDKHNLDVEW